jgi:predicted phosphodiesterase
MNNSITVIGDVHGKYKLYHEIIRQSSYFPYTVQLGDFGFKYETLNNVDPNKHKVIGGNHDNYSSIINIPHYLGDFGYSCLNGVDFFYYRGAYSIDKQYRTIGVDWWAEEQLSAEQFMEARKLYREVKPKIVITHDCPELLYSYYLRPTDKIYQNQTSYFLNELYNIHQPDLWIHGHWHLSKITKMEITKFVCIGELQTYTIEC